MADAYDLVPYTEHAYAEASPDHLRVMAALHGFAPALQVPGLTPRVLELGCGRGGNLLPLAAAWPDASFVGVDRSPMQIRDASRVAEAASLRNVTFLTGDVTLGLPGVAAEAFDVVICHGVYSWIPPEARRTLLARVRGALAEAGIAYVSFNTLPGWYRRLAARDWMRFAAGGVGRSLGEGLGGPRDALGWLAEVVSPELSRHRADLRAVHERLRATDAAYLTHEYLADEHHPVYASTFVEEAGLAGLAYLGDAVPADTAPELLPEPVRLRVASLATGPALTLVDFVRDTAFRRALLVRSDAALRSDFRALRPIDPRAIVGLRVASRLRPCSDAGVGDLESFEGGGAVVQVGGAVRRALRVLAAAAPRSVPCEELARAVHRAPESLAIELAELWLATPGLDLHEREPDLATGVSLCPRASGVSLCPRASGVARWHAIEGGPITNAWHQEVELPEPVVRFVLGKLDGHTTVAALGRAVAERYGSQLSGVEASAVVGASLELLARSALLVG